MGSRASLRKCTLVTGLVVFSSTLADSGWTESTRVAELVPTSKHYYEFRLHLQGNPSGCASGQWFYQDYPARGASEMFNALLQAIGSDLGVKVYVTGKCNINGHAEVSAVALLR